MSRNNSRCWRILIFPRLICVVILKHGIHSMLSFKKLCSRQDVYRNYDYDVGHHVVFRPDMSDATVVRDDDPNE